MQRMRCLGQLVLFGASAVAVSPWQASGQVSITSTSPVSQSFDSMGASATAALPAGFKIGTDWATGTMAATAAAGTSGTGAVTSSSSGGVYNWANGVTASSTDRALGFLTSGTFTSPRSIVYAFTNNTGAPVISLDLAWDFEKYRSGTRAFDWTFFHGNTSTASTAATAGNQSYAADGANTVVNPPTSVSKSFTLTGLSIPHGSTYYLRWTYTGVGGNTNAQGLAIDNFSIKANTDPSATAITGTATASAFSTTYGTPSTEQSFPVSGANLSADILATAPAGFEVSSDGTTYAPTATFAQSSGSASGTLRIRLAATSSVTGSYNAQNIALTTTGASTVNITTSASGNVVNPKALTITGLTAQDKNWDGTTTATVSGTPAYAGLVNGETFAVTGTVTWAFENALVGATKPLVRSGSFDVPSTNYTLTQPVFTASIIAIVPPAPSITAITPGNQQLSVGFTAPANDGGSVITNYEYSINGGGAWVTPSPAVTTSPLLITGLVNGTTYDVQLRAVNSVGPGAASATAQGAPVAPSSATIVVTPGVLGGTLSSTYGVASSLQSFTVSGSVLSGNLTVSAPAGLELSLDSDGVFSDQLNLTATGGSVPLTTLYVRLKASASAGSYNGLNIVVSGGGATSQSVATSASGNTQSAKELSVTGLAAQNKEYNATTVVSVTGTAAFDGLVNGDTFTPTGSVTWAFADKTVGTAKTLVRTGDYAAPSANYTVTQPVLTASITAKNLTVIGTVVVTRPYNAGTSATLTGATLDGVIAEDVVTLTNATTGTFSQANVGENLSVTTNMQLSGGDAGNYTVTQPTLTGTIVKADQTITFGQLAARSITDAPFDLVASTNSGLPITYTNSNDAVATLSGATVTIVSIGSTTITASQAGDDNYNEATSVERELVVTPVPLLWNFTGGVDTAATAPANVTPSSLSRGNNNGTTTLLTTTSASPTASGFSGTHNAGAAARTGVLDTAASGSAYFEFTITPATGFKATITGLSFGNRSTATGPQAYSLRSSADGYASDVLTGTLANDSGWALKSHTGLSVGLGSATTYRIYGYAGAGNAQANTANWRVDDIRVLLTTVAKSTPSITTVPTASPITLGQTLASSVLSGGAASVPGTFAFTTPSTAPAAGTSSQSVTFTPTDSLNNNSVTLNVDVTVTGAPAEDPLFTDPSKNAVLSDVAGGAKRLSFTGIPGRVYGIQRSANLSGWTQIDTVTAPENGVVTFDDPAPLAGKGFYRIVYPAAQ